MAVLSRLNRNFLADSMRKRAVIADGAMKFALLTSAYTPTYVQVNEVWTWTGVSAWADVSANEVAAGSGYTAGGWAVSAGVEGEEPRCLFDISNAGLCTLRADNPRWYNLTKTFRYGVLYGDYTNNTVVKPLILIVTFDDTPADVVVTANNWMAPWAAAGFLRMSLDS